MMEDPRIKIARWTFGGREWELCCNMNVLADVQALYGGDLGEALAGTHTMRTLLDFLAAMMNDFADSSGWQIRYTGRQLGRLIAWQEYEEIQGMIMDLVTGALTPKEEEAPEDPEEEPEKN